MQRITATLDAFPDEIIIQILSQSKIDLKTLGILMFVSTKIRRLSIHVLMLYRLPAVKLALTIEQEGKSRMTTRFEFCHFCPRSLNTLFTADLSNARRYYTNKACPVVRSMSIEDDFQSEFLTLVGNNDTTKTHPCYATSPDDSYPHMYYPNSAKKLSAQKGGFYILQLLPWKLAYRITNVQKPEYYLKPINITVGFQHLIRLEYLNNHTDQHMYKIFKMNRIKKWAIRLFST